MCSRSDIDKISDVAVLDWIDENLDVETLKDIKNSDLDISDYVRQFIVNTNNFKL